MEAVEATELKPNEIFFYAPERDKVLLHDQLVTTTFPQLYHVAMIVEDGVHAVNLFTNVQVFVPASATVIK